jgi:hypothetical protein
MDTGGSSPEIKRPGCEADHTSANIAEFSMNRRVGFCLSKSLRHLICSQKDGTKSLSQGSVAGFPRGPCRPPHCSCQNTNSALSGWLSNLRFFSCLGLPRMVLWLGSPLGLQCMCTLFLSLSSSGLPPILTYPCLKLPLSNTPRFSRLYIQAK